MTEHRRNSDDTTTQVRTRSDAARSERDKADAPHARVYRVLGEQYLRPPDREHVNAIADWAIEWRRSAPSLPPSFDSALERIEAGKETEEDTLKTAFTRLFRGISEGNSPAPPYESLYVDGQFFSQTTTEIQQGYRWAGTDVDNSQSNEPADHLGLELQFLGELVTMDDSDTGPDGPDVDEAKWWLLDEHLTEWLPAYHARLQREDPPEYYAGLLDLALAVVTEHHDRLADGR